MSKSKQEKAAAVVKSAKGQVKASIFDAYRKAGVDAIYESTIRLGHAGVEAVVKEIKANSNVDLETDSLTAKCALGELGVAIRTGGVMYNNDKGIQLGEALTRLQGLDALKFIGIGNAEAYHAWVEKVMKDADVNLQDLMDMGPSVAGKTSDGPVVSTPVHVPPVRPTFIAHLDDKNDPKVMAVFDSEDSAKQVLHMYQNPGGLNVTKETPHYCQATGDPVHTDKMLHIVYCMESDAWGIVSDKGRKLIEDQNVAIAKWEDENTQVYPERAALMDRLKELSAAAAEAKAIHDGAADDCKVFTKEIADKEKALKALGKELMKSNPDLSSINESIISIRDEIATLSDSRKHADSRKADALELFQQANAEVIAFKAAYGDHLGDEIEEIHSADASDLATKYDPYPQLSIDDKCACGKGSANYGNCCGKRAFLDKRRSPAALFQGKAKVSFAVRRKDNTLARVTDPEFAHLMVG